MVWESTPGVLCKAIFYDYHPDSISSSPAVVRSPGHPPGLHAAFACPSDFENGQTILQRRCRQNVSRYRFATVPFTGRSLPRSLDSK